MLTWNNLEESIQRQSKQTFSKNNILFEKIERKGLIDRFIQIYQSRFYLRKLTLLNFIT